MVLATVGSKKATVPTELATQENTMTPNSMPSNALLGYVANLDQDTLREILEHTLQALIEAEAAAVVGAQPHERTGGPGGAPQRAPAADGGQQRGPAGAGDPQAAPGELPTEPVWSPGGGLSGPCGW